MHGKKNIAWGFLFLGVFMITGFYLGFMHDISPERDQWIAQSATGMHFELRVAHAHSGLFGLINVAVGLTLIALPVPAARARIVSWLAILGLLMPIGVLLHALFTTPPAIVFIGGAAMVLATVWLGLEALAGRSNGSS